MKKTACVLIVVAIFFLLGFLPATYRNDISIQADPFAVIAKLKDTAGYQQWLLNNKWSVSIRSYDATSVTVVVQHATDSVAYLLEVLPSIEQNQSLVRSSTSTNYWTKWLDALGFTHKHSLLGSRLKQVMEDPVWRYGFEINLSSVQDSIILTAKDTLSNTTVLPIEDSLFRLLRKDALIASPGNPIMYCYISSVAIPGGNTELAVGVPVTNRPHKFGSSLVLVLPPKGRVLVGKSKLQYRDRLIKAMNEYVYDHRLKRVAQAMDQYPVDEDGIVRNPNQLITIILPVY